MLDGDVPTGRAIWEPLKGSSGIVQFWYAVQAEFSAELAARVGPETDRLDIEPFLPRERPEDKVAAFGRLDEVYDPTADFAAAPVEVDLGELDLGDLEFDLDPEPITEPDPEPSDVWGEPETDLVW